MNSTETKTEQSTDKTEKLFRIVSELKRQKKRVYIKATIDILGNLSEFRIEQTY
jgi:hypothetical protein